MDAWNRPVHFMQRVKNIWITHGLDCKPNDQMPDKREAVLDTICVNVNKDKDLYSQWEAFIPGNDDAKGTFLKEKPQCICSKTEQKDLYYLKNIYTNDIIHVGSSCIKLFEVDNDSSSEEDDDDFSDFINDEDEY